MPDVTLLNPTRLRQQEIPPNDAVLQRGIAACKRGDLEAAAKDLETVVLVEPKNAEALNWYGYVLLRLGKVEQAIPYLERVLILRPDDPNASTNLGNALLVRPKRTADDTRKAVSLFERAAQQAPNSGDTQYNLGYALARTGQYERAVVSYRRAVALQPKNGLAWTNLGYALIQLGKSKEAAEALRKGVTFAPEDSNTWIVLGSLELANGDPTASMTALQNARKLDPQNPAILSGLGRAYTALRRYPEAVEAYGTAADIAEAKTDGKKDVSPRYNQGLVLAQWGKLGDALAAYEKVLALEPNHYDALVNSGYVLFRQKKVDEAVQRFKDAIKVNNKIPLAWTNLAAACEAQKNWSGAVFAWRRALALDSKKYEWRAYMAADFLQMQRYADAAAVYKEMGTLWPTAAEPYLELGKVYEVRAEGEADAAKKIDWLVQARNAYEEALRREPQSGDARAAVERLRARTQPAPTGKPAGNTNTPTPAVKPPAAAAPAPVQPAPAKPAPVTPPPPKSGGVAGTGL